MDGAALSEDLVPDIENEAGRGFGLLRTFYVEGLVRQSFRVVPRQDHECFERTRVVGLARLLRSET
jgi:hypothetical protein